MGHKQWGLMLASTGRAFATFPNCDVTVATCCSSRTFLKFAGLADNIGGSMTANNHEDPTCSLLNFVPAASTTVCGNKAASSQSVCTAIAESHAAQQRIASGAPMLGVFVTPGTCQDDANYPPGFQASQYNHWADLSSRGGAPECFGKIVSTASNATYGFVASSVSCPREATKGLGLRAKWISYTEKKVIDGVGGVLPMFDVCADAYEPDGVETSVAFFQWHTDATGQLGALRWFCQEVPPRVASVDEVVIPYHVVAVSVGEVPPCQYAAYSPAPTAKLSTPTPSAAWDSSASLYGSKQSQEDLNSLGSLHTSLTSSSSSDSSGSDSSWLGQASGSSGLFLELWQWVGLLAITCLTLVAAGVLYTLATGRNKMKRRAKDRPPEPIATGYEQDAEAHELAPEHSQLPLLQPIYSTASAITLPSYSITPANGPTGSLPAGAMSASSVAGSEASTPGQPSPYTTPNPYSISNSPYASPGPYSGLAY